MESEKENFGVSGTIYDFKENDPREVNKKYSKLKVDVEKLEKTVNVKAMQLLDKCEVKVSFHVIKIIKNVTFVTSKPHFICYMI